ncbi:AT-hook motif nuclear-localized protein 14-like [Aristolochia californica]|uniref:AT-hook motif nuclear-localized protein 14-like n=1 Tax=Aristolochia californica TaxID=171875 RepID=UPI0035DB64B4
MEDNKTGGGLTSGSYYHHHLHHHHNQQQQLHPDPHNVNDIFSNTPGAAHYRSADPPPVFTQSAVHGEGAEAAPKRKRGRPRKYGPGGPASANLKPSSKKPLAASSSLPLSSSPVSATQLQGKDIASSSGSKRKAHLEALGNAGQGFTPHVVTVAPGEDVAQKIMSFMQQGKRAVCVLSASGSISNASLQQPAMLGGNVCYEGRFEILSLSGSYLHNEIGGASSRTGGLSVCLSGSDGRIVGGGVGGPLKAAGPVQVIMGSFIIDGKRDDTPLARVESPMAMVGQAVSNIRFRPTQDSTSRTSPKMKEDQLSIGASSFILQCGMLSSRSTDWRVPNMGPDGGGFSGMDDGACQSPEEGDDG